MKERWRKEGRRERKAKGVERGRISGRSAKNRREKEAKAIERKRKTKQEKTRMTGRGRGGERVQRGCSAVTATRRRTAATGAAVAWADPATSPRKHRNLPRYRIWYRYKGKVVQGEY